MQVETRKSPVATGYLIRQGAAGGLTAAIVFVLYAAIMGWLLDGDFFKPLRMMATLTLGENALARWNSLFAVVLHGIFILVVFSAIFGALFGHMLSRRPYIGRSARRLLLAGIVYGAFLWIMIFYIVSPVFGWVWFPLEHHFILEGFVGHTFFFGAVLGLFFVRLLHPDTSAQLRSGFQAGGV